MTMPLEDLKITNATQAGIVQAISFGYGSEPRGFTGIEKLAQQFFICLLTRKGSAIDDSTYGTSLSTLQGQANMGTDDALARVLAIAIGEAAAWFRANQPATLSADERLAGAELAGVIRYDAGAGVGVRVTLASFAGAGVTVSGPIN